VPVIVDENFCIGCGECVEVCPGDLFVIDEVKGGQFCIPPKIVGIA